jgi:hypothetical protein
VSAQGALHYHGLRLTRVMNPYEEVWTVLSSDWTQEESQAAIAVDEQTYVPAENQTVEWYAVGPCDCDSSQPEGEAQ